MKTKSDELEELTANIVLPQILKQIGDGEFDEAIADHSRQVIE